MRPAMQPPFIPVRGPKQSQRLRVRLHLGLITGFVCEYGPTKPPTFPVALMKAMVPAMAVPESKVGKIEKNAGRQAFIPMSAIAMPAKVSGKEEYKTAIPKPMAAMKQANT